MVAVPHAPTRGQLAFIIATACLVTPASLLAQGGMPVGPEFQINTYTTSAQQRPVVASDSAGNFVVAWDSAFQDGGFYGIYAQRFDSTGTPVGAEFRVNSYTTLVQLFPAVASDAAGNFVVVWESLGQSYNYGVFAQRYSSTGAPLGGEFRVNTYTAANKRYPQVASDAAGNFVVVWQSYYQDGPFDWGIYAQRFASTGAPLGGEFRVNAFFGLDQLHPSVGCDSLGGFVVAWQSEVQDGSGFGIYAQRYAGTGAPLGGEFRVNTYTTDQQAQPSLNSDAAGNFVIVWRSRLQFGQGYNLVGQRFASAGAPLGVEFRVNTYDAGYQLHPSVASDADGNFVVVWDSGPSSQDASGYGVFAQRYASTGAPLGVEFRVNSYTTHNQRHPSVTAEPTGEFVMVWDSYLQDAGTPGIFGQRYRAMVPVELVGFRID